MQIPPTEEHPKGGIVVTYSARVRVTVYSQDGSRKVARERSGGHRGFGPTVGQAVEDCIQAAETDGHQGPSLKGRARVARQPVAVSMDAAGVVIHDLVLNLRPKNYNWSC